MAPAVQRPPCTRPCAAGYAAAHTPVPSRSGVDCARHRRTSDLRTLLGADPPAVGPRPARRAPGAELAGVIATPAAPGPGAWQAAYDASLKHVPFPVRGIVKKVLLG